MYRLIATVLLVSFMLQSSPRMIGGNLEDLTELEKGLTGLESDTARVNLLIRLGEYYCSRDFDQALLYLQDALILSTELQYKKGIAESLLWQGRAFYYKDDYTLAFRYLDRSRQLFEEISDMDGLARYHYAAGVINHIIGNHIYAIQDFQKVIELSELSGNRALQAKGHLSMGGFYNGRAEFRLAMTYLTEALSLSREMDSQTMIATVITNIGRAHENANALDSARYYYEKGLAVRTSLNESRGIASSEYILGKLFIKKRQYRDAMEKLESSQEIFAALKDDTGIGISKIQMAEALSLSGEHSLAIDQANQAMEIAALINNPNLISDVYSSLASIMARKQDYQSAYQYTMAHAILKDSLSQANRERLIQELEVKFQTERKDNEIQLLISQNEIHRKNNLILSISIAALVFILLSFFIVLRLKTIGMARQREIYEQEKTIHRQASELREKEQLIMRDQLECQNRELASKALEMLRVNETIGSIIEKLEMINRQNSRGDEVSSQINGIISGLEAQLKDNSWNEFEKIFKQIHSGFFQKILGICPDLSPAELKIAAFLKLNLSTKEIAAISYKSESGIKSTRYRLRKKLGITSEDSLIPFLMKL